MRELLIDFLKRLEAMIPPPPHCHHVITYAQYGSDAAGWEDRLSLQVNLSGKFYCFFIDETDDFVSPSGVDQILCQIHRGVENMQEGIALGQYSEAR